MKGIPVKNRSRLGVSREDWVWEDNEVERLRRLWADGISISECGRRLGRPRSSIAGKITRMRNLEGEARWRAPGAPVGLQLSKVAGDSRVRRNRALTGSTLPPLASLADDDG